jgi:hypothetical protein
MRSHSGEKRTNEEKRTSGRGVTGTPRWRQDTKPK